MGQPCRGIPAGLPFLLASGRKSIFVFVSLNVYFAALMAATKGSPLDGTKFHLDGPGPSRALDPLFDAA